MISKKHDEEPAEVKPEAIEAKPERVNETVSGVEGDIADIMKFVGAFKGDFKGDAKSLRAAKSDELNQRDE